MFPHPPFYFFTMKHKQTSLIFANLWLLITTVLLCIPGKKLPTISWFHLYQVDKIVHFGIFLLLSSLYCRYLYIVKNSNKHFFLIALLATIYGILMEFVQKYFIPNRSFDIWDIFADTIGSYSVYIILILYPKPIKPDQ